MLGDNRYAHGFEGDDGVKSVYSYSNSLNYLHQVWTDFIVLLFKQQQWILYILFLFWDGSSLYGRWKLHWPYDSVIRTCVDWGPLLSAIGTAVRSETEAGIANLCYVPSCSGALAVFSAEWNCCGTFPGVMSTNINTLVRPQMTDQRSHFI